MLMGNYIVAVQHLRLLHMNLQKEQHGLREREIDCKDKQNFDAVIDIIRVSPYLEKIPVPTQPRQNEGLCESSGFTIET